MLQNHVADQVPLVQYLLKIKDKEDQREDADSAVSGLS